MTAHQPARLFVMFGATGDLALRMLWPSLYGLQSGGLLPEGLRLLGTARGDMDQAAFLDVVADAIRQRVAASELHADALQSLMERIDYVPAQLDDAKSATQLCERIAELRAGDIVYHLSVAPRFYVPICQLLAAHDLSGPGTRVMLEKPIGHDRASADEINEGVGACFDESQVYRVDHYLGKEGVQNLIALRFGNGLFEPLWNARHVEQVQITVAETVGVEGRGDYYDHSGASRDMLQNHLLQMLALVAMEPPSQFLPTAVRDEKVKVLRSLRPIAASNLATDVVSGQYTAGAIDGVAVPGYAEELCRDSDRETFVAVRAHVDNWRWSGVPFYMRTGKRMPKRCTEILVQFRQVPHSIFGGGAQRDIRPNALLIRLQPEERIELQLMSKTPGLDRHGLRLSQVALDLDFHEEFAAQPRRLAYERLYLDALEGNGTLFVRRDEIEAAWHWVDGILEAWRRLEIRPRPYPAGTWGPSAAMTLAERHDHPWRDCP